MAPFQKKKKNYGPSRYVFAAYMTHTARVLRGAGKKNTN